MLFQSIELGPAGSSATHGTLALEHLARHLRTYEPKHPRTDYFFSRYSIHWRTSAIWEPFALA